MAIATIEVAEPAVAAEVVARGGLADPGPRRHEGDPGIWPLARHQPSPSA